MIWGPLLKRLVLFATAFALWMSLIACAPVGYVASAASGFYTHDRIDRLEDHRIETLEVRVGELEREAQKEARQ